MKNNDLINDELDIELKIDDLDDVSGGVVTSNKAVCKECGTEYYYYISKAYRIPPCPSCGKNGVSMPTKKNASSS